MGSWRRAAMPIGSSSTADIVMRSGKSARKIIGITAASLLAVIIAACSAGGLFARDKDNPTDKDRPMDKGRPMDEDGRPASVMLGQMELTSCRDAQAYCGKILRPLDPAAGLTDQIAVSFVWFPHTDRTISATGTIVAVDGGPGYASTASSKDYLRLFDPLRRDRDLLIVDNRGTGRSGAVNCPDLQQAEVLTPDAVAACANSLDKAAYAYRSALAADDLSAILLAIGAGPVDLYGDSYGTFFAQVFAFHHPHELRSLILDSAYPAGDVSPWWHLGAVTLAASLEAACARSPGCGADPVKPATRLAELVRAVRQHPIPGEPVAGDNDRPAAAIDVPRLVNLMLSGALGPVFFREANAAMRAYLDDGDAVPLRRLMAESDMAGDPAGLEAGPKKFSAGLFVAVSCSDYPQAYDMHKPVVARAGDLTAAATRQDPDTFAPFTIAEFRQSPLQENSVDLCVNWRPAPAAVVTGNPLLDDGGAPLPAPDLPVLVLSGELDIGTTPIEGRQTAAMFPHANWILLKNSLHVTAIDETNECGANLVRHFIDTLQVGDASCAERIPPLRVMQRFSLTSATVMPARPGEDNEGHDRELRLADTVSLTAADIVARWWTNYDKKGAGLRGGSYRYREAGDNVVVFELDQVRWTEDVAVSGRLRWDRRSGKVRGRVTFRSLGGDRGRLKLTWNEQQAQIPPRITGTVNGYAIDAVSAGF